MTNKPSREADYSKLKQKIYLRLALIVAASLFLVFILRSLAQNRVSEWIVAFLQSRYHLGFGEAQTIYRYTIANNLEYITIAIIAVFIVVLSRLLILQLARYFNEVNSGIDTLIENEEKEITLSPELDFMERKLNVLRETLAKREREAKEAEQRKNDLVTYLAHDIKTPLTSVIGYLNLLDEAPDMPIEQKAKYVRIGLEKAYRLEALINEFFEITRYNLQTITLAPRSIDLPYMLMQLADEVFPQLAHQGKSAVVHAAEDLVVYGDPNKLARAFNNILKNAIAYGEKDSVIEITAEAESDGVVIRFKNEGSVPQDKLQTIFEKFYRLDDARSSDTGGAGLGLAIAKEIVLLHGGSIRAESEGGYTVVTVVLPMEE